MKIEIELPEWTHERNIYIMAGIELVAYKYPLESHWNIKVKRCIQCGKCCENCDKLTSDGDNKVCSLGINRPFRCCITNGKEYCQEQFDKVL